MILFSYSDFFSDNEYILVCFRIADQRSGKGDLIKPSYFPPHETFRAQAIDSSPGDRLGFSVSLSGRAVLVGAPGVDQGGQESGAVYYMDVGLHSVRFTKKVMTVGKSFVLVALLTRYFKLGRNLL